MTIATAAERRYQSGFGNEYATEAVPGALPQGRNSPQRAPFDLYPELISGTAFTAPRHENRRTWLYRRQPSVVAGRYQAYAQPHWTTGADREMALAPEPLRWAPLPLDGADYRLRRRHAHRWPPTAMPRRRAASARWSTSPTARWNAAPSSTPTARCWWCRSRAALVITTEMGVLDVKPGEIALLPRGVAFKVELLDGPSRGYVCENYGAHFRLPELGPIGSNGLANARDFQAPVAAFEDATVAARTRQEVRAAASGRRRPSSRPSTWSPGTATWRR